MMQNEMETTISLGDLWGKIEVALPAKTACAPAAGSIQS